MIVDYHHHLLSGDDYADNLLRQMDAAGIDIACLNGLGVPSDNWLGDTSPDNAAVAAVARRHPDRIAPIGVIRLGVSTPDDVRRLRDSGFVGLKTTRPMSNYDARHFDPIYAAAAQEGMSLLVHTGFIVPSKTDPVDDVSSARCRPVHLDRVARTFPDLVIVMAHLGMPWFEEASQMCRFHPNVYTDLSGSLEGWRNRMPVSRLRDLFYWENAWDKVVFGTDVHFSEVVTARQDYDRILADLDIDGDTYGRIMGGTAHALITKGSP